MKIRNPRLVSAAGWLGTRFAQLLFRTLRFEYCSIGTRCDPAETATDERRIYCGWHENLLLPTLAFGSPQVVALLSGHADAQILGSLFRALGMGTVSGSSTRGGVEAVRKLTGSNKGWRHLAVTPDGPRGPRRIVQPGAIYIASRTGMTIVPTGIGYCRPWRARSWDRFAVPKPFSRATLLFSEPIAVPARLKVAELEPYRLRVQVEMDRMTAIAEAWAATGRLALPEPARGRPDALAS